MEGGTCRLKLNVVYTLTGVSSEILMLSSKMWWYMHSTNDHFNEILEWWAGLHISIIWKGPLTVTLLPLLPTPTSWEQSDEFQVSLSFSLLRVHQSRAPCKWTIRRERNPRRWITSELIAFQNEKTVTDSDCMIQSGRPTITDFVRGKKYEAPFWMTLT